MANTFANTSWVSREGLEIIQPRMFIAKSLNNDYNSEFGREDMKVGDTIQVPLPQQYLGRTGEAVNIENLQDRTTPVTVNVRYGVDFQISSKEMKLNVMDATKRYVKPAMVNMAAYADRLASQVMALTCPNQVGTAGTAFTTDQPLRDAQVILDEAEAPVDDERWAAVSSRQEQSLLKATSVYFNDQTSLGEQYKNSRFSRTRSALGFHIGMTQNIPRLTGATYGGTPVVSGANQTGNVLAVSGLTGTTLTKGTIFTVAGTYNVEPIGKSTLAGLTSFVVTADTAISTTTNIPIYPSISVVGQYQNVSNSPANGAALTMSNTSASVGTRGFAYHRDAYTMAWVSLPEPKKVESCTTATDEETGVSVRSMVFYDGRPDVFIYRFDMQFAVSPLYPQWCCQLVSN